MKHESTRGRVPVALGWLIVFAAILAHLPELRAWFAQDDWDSLARATGSLETPALAIRPFSTLWSWKLLHAMFGLRAVAYHATALMGFGLLALWTLRLGARIGLGQVGLAVAGIWVVATPFALRPVSWASASGEIWAALFALMALDLWFRPASSRRAWPVAAAALAMLSLSAKEAGLVLPLLMLYAQRAWNPAETWPARRARNAALALVIVSAALTAWLVARHFSAGGLDAYALGNPAVTLENLVRAGFWFLTPFRPATAQGSDWIWWLGAILWSAWAVDALRGARRGHHEAGFTLVLTLGSLAPVLALSGHFESYYLLLGTCGVGLWLGGWGQRLLPPRIATPALLVGTLVVVSAATAWRSQATMSARLVDGRLADPILRRGAIALQTHRQLGQLPTLETTPLVAVLQATRVELPADAGPATQGTIVVTTPVVRALQGGRGLRMLLPAGVDGRWVTNLDELPLDTMVLLDVGDERLRVLGPLENARMYSALIAISAGQFPRARHDLWKVIGTRDEELRFAFRADNLPIAATDLDAQAEPFVRFLEAEDQPSSGQILHLFAQLYEAVRGERLLVEDWLRAERSPRAED